MLAQGVSDGLSLFLWCYIFKKNAIILLFNAVKKKNTNNNTSFCMRNEMNHPGQPGHKRSQVS